jgi:copper chaperone
MKFDVEGMTCGHCVRAITRAIHTLDPDARVDVDLAQGVVTVEGQLMADAVADVIAREG